MRAVVISDTSNRSVIHCRGCRSGAGRRSEVLVDVKACGVNFTDLLSLDGKYQNNPPPPFTPGKDAAGIVAAVGANVSPITRSVTGLSPMSSTAAMAEKTDVSGRPCVSIARWRRIRRCRRNGACLSDRLSCADAPRTDAGGRSGDGQWRIRRRRAGIRQSREGTWCESRCSPG